jgi:hypothetical protein
MKEKDARKGIEVMHPTYGRGTVNEYQPKFGSEPDDPVVHFYERDFEKMLPVYEVEPAAKAVTTSITRGSFGFQALVDDGHAAVTIQPDGDDGYTIEARIDGELQDSATLSLERA